MDQQIAVKRRGRALAELTPYHHPHAEVFLANELPVEVVAVDLSRSERGVE